MIIQRLVVSLFQANCYIVGNEHTGEAIVIDPGDEADRILDALRLQGLTARLIIATHGHLDHVMALGPVKAATGAPILMHRGDQPLLDNLPMMAQSFLGQRLPPPPPVDQWLEEGQTVGLEALGFKVLFTPGHSWGSVSLYWAPPDPSPADTVKFIDLNVRRWRGGGIVFSGDALFQGSIGRTDLGGDFPTLAAAIRSQLFTLPDETLVLSGHGEPTTIGFEKRTNPFVGEAADVE
ncbi:MAG: MBL fold metallo-hydrolase [Anaerolineae bacterium]|nr:MBL fold metallo-hydrolase [Anaerolineae bacterium]